jgi:hypothetical protein
MTLVEQSPYRRLTAEVVRDAENFARTGATNGDVATLIGVHRATLQRWLAEGRRESERRFAGHDPDPALDLPCDLYNKMRRAHAGIVAVAAGSWVQAARTDWRAAQALLATRFHHWRPGAFGDGTTAEGAGNADDAADLAEAQLNEAQANAIVEALRSFGEALLDAAEEEGVEAARLKMGVLARDALTGGEAA